MNKLQFNSVEDCLYSPLSPDVVDINSDSGDGFTVEPNNITQLGKKFGINLSGSNLMSAFVESSIATLFPQNDENVAINNEINTAGIQLERNSRDLVGDARAERSSPPNSFVDSRFEQSNLFPRRIREDATVNLNSYESPTATVLSTPRINSEQRGILPRPEPTYPLSFRPGTSNFQASESMEHQDFTQAMSVREFIPNITTRDNLTTMLFPIPKRGANTGLNQPFST